MLCVSGQLNGHDINSIEQKLRETHIHEAIEKTKTDAGDNEHITIDRQTDRQAERQTDWRAAVAVSDDASDGPLRHGRGVSAILLRAGKDQHALATHID